MPRTPLVALLITVLFALLPAGLAHANGPLYTVQPGDTMIAIANTYGISAAELAAANGLSQDGWLQPGQQLTIPIQPTMPYGAPPPAAAYTGFGSQIPYTPEQYFEPALSQFAASTQTMPSSAWPSLDPQQASTNYTQYPPDSFWDQPAQYPPVGLYSPERGSSPYYAPQPVQTSYQPVFNQMATGYYPNQDYPAYQPYLPQTPAFYPPANTAPGWQPANNFGPAMPPRRNPALFTPNGEKWIDVNLSTQTLTALEGQTPVYRTLVSTGVWDTPTVVGTFNIYVKFEKADMSGGSGISAYDLKDVPYVMYFHGDYGMHGTYWHMNFGRPMSHGCVNLHTLDAKWLYNWAPVGTKVVTHY